MTFIVRQLVYIYYNGIEQECKNSCDCPSCYAILHEVRADPIGSYFFYANPEEFMDYISQAEPRAKTEDGFTVFCSHDELVPIEKVVPNPKNPNTHPQEQIELLGNIIRANGWRQPITVSKRSGFVVKGHGRLEAAHYLHCSVVPVDYQNYTSEAEEYADMVADNRIAELADMDNAALAKLIEEIGEEVPTELAGYTDEELTRLMNSLPDTKNAEEQDGFDVDEAADLPAFVEPGDIWMLGRHRLMCGDSTSEDDMKALMDGVKANIVITDPPYNVDINSGGAYEKQKAERGEKTVRKILNDNMDEESFMEFLVKAFTNIKEALADGGCFYIWYADTHGLTFRQALYESGLELRQNLIWEKDTFTLGRQDYQWNHEPCMYGWKDGAGHNWFSDRKQSTVVKFNRPKASKLHPTMKPLPLIGYQMKNSCQENGVVLDPFGGSGTTLIACEQLNRIGYTMELDTGFASTIVRRYIALTGASPDDISVLRGGQEYKMSNIYVPTVDELEIKDGSVEDGNE